jgi:hypothetical protein
VKTGARFGVRGAWFGGEEPKFVGFIGFVEFLGFVEFMEFVE